MTISIAATRAIITNDVSLDGPTTVTSGSGNNTYNITDYNRFSVYSATSTVGTASISGAVLTLNVPSTAATQIVLSVTKDGKISRFVIAVGASSVVQPSITSPSQGQTNVILSPTLTSSAFATAPAGIDTHQSSQWQIASDAGFTTIVWDSGVTTTNKTSITVPSGTLALNTTYYARMRQTGATLGNSAYSATRTFTTSNQYIATPTVSVQGGSANVDSAPTFTTSAFTVVNGADTHVSTDWQVLLASNNSVVWQSLGNTANKTSITMPDNLLTVSTNYIVKVRFTGSSLGNSAYGQQAFTTAASFFQFIPANVGLPYGGGYYSGNIVVGGITYALIDAPKTQGGENPAIELTSVSPTGTLVNTTSNDGVANTAIIEAFPGGSPAVTWVRSLNINGYTDWYIPSADEVELLYRYNKPTTDSNATTKDNPYNDPNGTNPNSAPVGARYTATNPSQTAVTAFKTGGSEAFLPSFTSVVISGVTYSVGYYWTSTRATNWASNSRFYAAFFADGYQGGGSTRSAPGSTAVKARVRAVRRVQIS